jgi:hypothetical protein
MKLPLEQFYCQAGMTRCQLRINSKHLPYQHDQIVLSLHGYVIVILACPESFLSATDGKRQWQEGFRTSRNDRKYDTL